jgi:hypothetical protein
MMFLLYLLAFSKEWSQIENKKNQEMTKNRIDNRLKTYASIAAAIVAAGNADAQVVYTDVSPDQTLNSFPSSFNIDLDANAVIDFTIEMIQPWSSQRHLQIVPIASNSIVASNPLYGGSYVAVLNQGVNINASANFKDYGFERFMAKFTSFYTAGSTYMYTKGNWTGSHTDKYIGLRFKIGSNTHYGWVRLDASIGIPYASGNWSVTIKDFAYESSPNTGILAGDMGGTTNLNERFATTKIFAANKQINLAFNEADFSNTQISVYNNLGQLVHQQEAANQKEIIDMSTYPMGIYIVKLQTAGAVLSKKIIIK